MPQFLAALLTAGAFGQTQPPASGQLGIALEKDSTLVWGAKAGRAVRIKEPQLTLEDPNDHARLPFKVELKKSTVQNGQAVLEYALSLVWPSPGGVERMGGQLRPEPDAPGIARRGLEAFYQKRGVQTRTPAFPHPVERPERLLRRGVRWRVGQDRSG